VGDQKYFPEKAVECNFSDQDEKYVELYKNFVGNKDDTLMDSFVDFELFKKCYPIFAFDLSNRDNSVFENMNNVKIVVEAELENDPSEPFYMFAVVAYDKGFSHNYASKEINKLLQF